MRPRWFYVIAILVVGLLIFNRSLQRARLETRTITTEPPRVAYQVELAQTSDEVRRGLMGRIDLCSTCGMLFVFSKSGTYPFWMRNTFIALDILWLDAAGNPVYSVENVPPLRGVYRNETPAQYVLELPAGTISRDNLGSVKFVLNGIM